MLEAPMTTLLASVLPMLLVGLAGSVHCVGMCGGIVSAFSLAPARAFPVAVVREAPPVAAALGRVLAYNAGRITSYAAAGAFAGGFGAGVSTLAGLASVEAIGLWLVNLVLVALGLHLAGAWQALAPVERVGAHLWRRVQPLTALLLPLDRPHKLFAMGALWGALPCGMVYSGLLAALVSGSAQQGALLMLAFGLGTLPLLAVVGVAGQKLRQLLQGAPARRACGLLVAGFGVAGLLRAAGGAQALLPGLCIAP